MGTNCKEIEEGLEEFLEGEIPPLKCEEIENHLQSCIACRNLVKSHQEIHAKIREKGPVSPSPKIRANVMEKISGNPLPTNSSLKPWNLSLMTILPMGMILVGGMLAWTWFSSPAPKTNQKTGHFQTSVSSKTVVLTIENLASETASQSISIEKTPE